MSPRSSMKLIFLLLITFLLNACGGLNTTQSTTSSSSTCPANKLAKSSTGAALHSKLNREDFVGSSNLNISSQKIQSIMIDSEQLLTTVVDTECLKNQTKAKSSLTRNIKFRDMPLKFGNSQALTLKTNVAMTFEELENLVEADECIKAVSPEVEISLAALPNDSRLNEQTHLSAIKYQSVYDHFFTGGLSIKSDTVIAIIDDGIDLSHNELKNTLWTNLAEKNGSSGVDDDNNGYIDDINGYDFGDDDGNPSHNSSGTSAINSHGTHVAGLITATTNNSSGISGLMAKNAKIMALNIFSSNGGNASATNLTNAISYAVGMGAKVINMSLSGQGSSTALQNAIKSAVSKGVTVVVAAGNNSQNLSAPGAPHYIPGNYGKGINGMITVGATDAKSSSLGKLCWFSNYSTAYVEVGAPGCYGTTNSSAEGLLSTIRNNSYGYLAGTSMASPVAAATAAIIYSYVRDTHNVILTPAQIENLLKSGSRTIASLSNQIEGNRNIDLETIKQEIEEVYGPANQPDPSDPADPDPCS